MRNEDIRAEIANAGLKLWMVADRLHIADYCFSRKLRVELPEEEKAKIRAIIAALKKEGSYGTDADR